MNPKQLTALAAAGVMTLCTGAAMLAISGFSTLRQPSAAVSSAPPPAAVQNVGLTSDPQMQQLQQAVEAYQAREQQYQQALSQAQTQLQQDQQQLQQYQQLLVMLQQQGALTFREGDDD